MKILAIEKELPGVPKNAFEPHLRAETARAWGLHESGVIRELYFRDDWPGAVRVLDCALRGLPAYGSIGYGCLMFRTIDDFLNGWQYESEATLKVFRELTDASLPQAVVPGGRTLGFLAWHITTAVSDMMAQAGLPVEAAAQTEAAPAKAAAIADRYARDAKAAAEAVRTAWTDAQLDDEIPMYGQTWKKSGVLSALIGHQAHHRGQMTVLMRQAGLKVPGVYGPAQEEWAAFGAAPQP